MELARIDEAFKQYAVNETAANVSAAIAAGNLSHPLRTFRLSDAY